METDANDARHGRSKPLPYGWASVHPFFCRIPSASKIDCKIDSGGSKPPPYRAYPHHTEHTPTEESKLVVRMGFSSSVLQKVRKPTRLRLGLAPYEAPSNLCLLPALNPLPRSPRMHSYCKISPCNSYTQKTAPLLPLK